VKDSDGHLNTRSAPDPEFSDPPDPDPSSAITRLYQIGTEVLSYTSASSMYLVRLFSEYGNIIEEKRARLMPTTGEKLLFLHHNLKRLD